MKNIITRNILTHTIKKIEGAYAPATIRAYKTNFEKFIIFCDELDECALPAKSDLVVQYIKLLTGGHLKSNSIRIAVAAIATIHKLNQTPDPTDHPEVKLELRRMYRTLGRECKQAYGITNIILQKMLKATDKNLRGIRDRVLLLIAYDSLCRRSELVSLQVEDLTLIDTLPEPSFKLRLRRSKTDQDAKGRWLYLSNETQKALNDWLKATDIQSGKIFRGIRKKGELSDGLNSSHINRIYKRLAKTSSLDPSIIKQISGHSIRVGAAQDLLLSGASLPIIMNRGRWTKPDTVMHYCKFQCKNAPDLLGICV
ncbi:site-specific integrase [Methylotenera versatilis]|uniref:Integrase family protein n=1 Tax=Methylotenera versatilis (strain 301) TaxID=666681 RepID=D7DHU9_METV0|nr:site-specific integrase [Methylotenera versatilis]ADI29634.1 integrase family protein [Methylotenera versatilis 301]